MSEIGRPWRGYYLTAYGLAVKHGFMGSESEWLKSLNGKSVYELAVEGGYTGTEEELAAILNHAMDATVYDPAGGTRQVAFADELPAAESEAPQMDGTAAAGASESYARGDHVHPTDTSRAPLASPAFTGTPTAPTAAAATDTTQIATTAFAHSLLTYGTSDLTPGTSALADGVVYMLYE